MAKRRPKASEREGYNGFREQQAEISRKASAARREIGPIPDLADVRRRARCRESLRLFCTTYNPEAFTLPFSPDQLREIERIEEAVRHGALYAFAEPRGNGKTTRVRMAALWAFSYGFSRYVFVIGANDDKATDTLAAIKIFVRFLPVYAADFPEISHPAQCLAGIANRASGQTCDGRPSMIEWAADRLVLPTVPPPKNWPKKWPLRADGMVPTSGAVVGVSGLTGEGIRGSLKTLTTGEQVRPDLVLIDDPQTHESARSKIQNQTREQLISADVLGMAGPGKAIAAVMPCTVIARGDFIDRILDRAKHPLWRGERTRLLKSMPANLAAWEDYFEVYRRCALKEPPDFEEANQYYLARRAVLDEGAEAGWGHRKLDWEVSAVQHAMHLYCRDRRAFLAEYQNDPEPDDLAGAVEELDAAAIAGKVNRCPRGVVPAEFTRLTAAVDVGKTVLWWCVTGWAEGFAAGSVIDRGVYPPQGRDYFAAADARPGLPDLPELARHDETARVYAGLRAVTDPLLTRRFPRAAGGDLQVDLCLVDAGWQTDTVHQFCRESPHAARLLPSRGYYIGASARPMAEWMKKPGERAGWNWRVGPATGGARGRTCLFDPNQWKSFVAERLLTPPGGKGCLALFGGDPAAHRLFADHLTAEYRVETEGRGRKLHEWKLRPDRPDNHWWDTLVGCAVAASVLGLVWSPTDAPTAKRKVKKVDIRELYDKAGGAVT